MPQFANAADFASDPDFDWTGGAPVETSPPASAALDFVIPDDYESGVDVDAIEAEQEERRFQSAPIGTHLFEVVDFLKPPELVTKTGFADGQPVTYEAYKVTVKFAVVGRPNQTILEYMELPPAGRDKVAIYKAFMKSSNGKVAGWFSRKFEQFLNRIGYPVVEGQPYPAEARAIRNWIGKQVYAEVVKGDGEARMNPSTGESYPVNNQFKNFSFRMAESTAVAGNAVAGNAAGNRSSASGPATQRVPAPMGGGQRPSAQQAGRAPAGTDAANFAAAGLDKI